MPDEKVLKLSSVDNLHPRPCILAACGPATIVRLRQDPTELPQNCTSREIKIDWLARLGDRKSRAITRTICWADVPDFIWNAAQRWKVTKNEIDITEQAAIGVMALIIHDLERAEIISVLQIGCGGDYLLSVEGASIQAEVSGIRVDPNGTLSQYRLEEKSVQVLSKSAEGFAFVATFSRGNTEDVQCYLHHVRQCDSPNEADFTVPHERSGDRIPKAKRRKRK